MSSSSGFLLLLLQPPLATCPLVVFRPSSTSVSWSFANRASSSISKSNPNPNSLQLTAKTKQKDDEIIKKPSPKFDDEVYERRRVQIPCMIHTPTGSNKQIMRDTFYYVSGVFDEKPVKFRLQYYLRRIIGHNFVGYSEGFIFSVDPRNFDLHATDAQAGCNLPVPSTLSFPFVADAVRKEKNGKLVHYVLTSCCRFTGSRLLREMHVPDDSNTFDFWDMSNYFYKEIRDSLLGSKKT